MKTKRGLKIERNCTSLVRGIHFSGDSIQEELIGETDEQTH